MIFQRDIDMAVHQYYQTISIWPEPDCGQKSNEENIEHCTEWYTRAEEKWSARVKEAVIDKRITPLLSTQGGCYPRAEHHD